MAQIKSGDRIQVKSDKRTFVGFALEDFDTTDEDKTVQVRIIEENDGIGPVTDAKVSDSEITVVEGE